MRDRAMRLHGDTRSLPSPSGTQAPRKGSANSDEVSILCGKPRLVESHVASAAVSSDDPVNAPPPSHRNTVHPVSAPITPHISQVSAPTPTYRSLDYRAHAQAPWDSQQPSTSQLYHHAPTSYPIQPTDPRPHSVNLPVSQDAWIPPHAPATHFQYPSATAVSTTVDFNLEDTWSNFFSEYGRL